jgi:hypothetical protein
MMAEETAGAIFDEEMGWHDIDWEAAHRNVRRQQARIVADKKHRERSRLADGAKYNPCNTC